MLNVLHNQGVKLLQHSGNTTLLNQVIVSLWVHSYQFKGGKLWLGSVIIHIQIDKNFSHSSNGM